MQSKEGKTSPVLQNIIVRPVSSTEEADFKRLMQAHHYLGALPKIGETIWYAASIHSKGFQRTRDGYGKTESSPKMVFVYPLQRNAQSLMSQPVLNENYQYGRTKIMLPVKYMQTLPDFFTNIEDPRREQGRRHSLVTVLSLSVAATLCGVKGYQGIFDWANSLGQKARVHFRCRKEKGRRVVPSLSIFRYVLISVDPDDIEKSLQQWSAIYGEKDESLAIDGKTMRGAIGEDGRQTHIMSAIGHHTQDCYAQKNMDDGSVERSPHVPLCRTGFCHRAQCHHQKNGEDLTRNYIRHHQPNT